MTTRLQVHEPHGAYGNFLDLEAAVDRDEDVEADEEEMDGQGTL